MTFSNVIFVPCSAHNFLSLYEFLDISSILSILMANSHLDKITKTIENNLQGILNYSKYPIITGCLEEINNKIRMLKRTAYGFRDMEFLKCRISFYSRYRTCVGALIMSLSLSQEAQNLN
jgi:hypothetical protein